MSERAMSILKARMIELGNLVEANPVYLPVTAVAEFLHVKPEALRASMEQGRCPFGFAWRLGEKAAYKVPTLAFYTWLLGSQAVITG